MSNDVDPDATDEEYSDYYEDVVLWAEEVLKEYNDDPEMKQLQDVIWSHVRGSRRVENNGYMQSTVLHSPQHPDNPDHCPPWTEYVDLTDNPTKSDVIGAMAEVCFYSDIMKKIDHIREDE